MEEKLERLYKILVEEQLITTDTLDTFKNRLENEEGYADAVADTAISEELYIGDKKNFEVEYFSELKKGKKGDDEEIVSQFDVKDEDLFDEQTVNDKFNPYIEALSNPDYRSEEVTDDKSRLAELARVESDKQEFLQLINDPDSKDKIKAAQLLENLSAKMAPSEEEVDARVKQQKDALQNTNLTQQSGGKFAGTSLMYALADKDNNADLINRSLPNQKNKDSWSKMAYDAQAKKWLKDPNDLSSGYKAQPEGTSLKGRDMGLWSKNAKKKSNEKSNAFYRQYEDMVNDITASVGLGGVTSDKSKANENTIYLPSIEQVKENPEIVNDIVLSQELVDRIGRDNSYAQIAADNLDKKENRDEIDRVLSEFEDKEGVGLWNDIVNITASQITVGNKHALEKAFGKTTDELFGIEGKSRDQYEKNKKDLKRLLELSKEGDDYKALGILNNIQNQTAGFLAEEKVLNDLKRKIESDPNATQADVDEFNNIKNRLLLSQKNIQADIKYLGDMQFEGANSQEIIDKTQKTYNFLETQENILANSGVRILTGLGSLATELNTINVLEHVGINLKNEDGSINQEWVEWGNDVLGETGGAILTAKIVKEVAEDNATDELLQKAYNYGEELLNRNRPPQRYDEIEGIDQAMRWGVDMLTGQVLNTGMSIVIPGGGGLLLSSLSESGNQMHEMKKRIEGEKWNEKEVKYINDFKKEFGFNPLGEDDTYKIKPEDINALQFYGTAGIYGIAEYASERITLGNFKLGAKNLRKAFDLSKGVKKGMPITNKINQRWINLRDAGKDFVKGIPGESLGEGAVTLSQNAAEIYILGNKDVSMLDGVDESMMSGLVMSGTMQSPGLLAQTYTAFRGPDANAKIAKRGMEMLNLSDQIGRFEAQLKGLTPQSDSYSDIISAKRLAENRLHDLAQQQLDSQSETRKNIVSYTKTDRQALIDTYNAEHKVRAEIDRINDNTALDPKVAEKLINEQEIKLVQLEAFKNSVVGNAEWNADKTRARKFSNAYRAKNNLLGQVEMIVGNNNKEALQAGLDYVDTRKDLTAEEKNQVKEQMKMTFEDAKKASRGDSTVNGFAFGDNLTVETTSPDGTKTTKKLDLPMTFALNRSNATVQSHEVGHHTLFKEFMENNPDAVGLVQDLESYVKKNYGKAYEVFLETKDLYGEYDSQGNLTNPTLVAEEKLARLSDFMRQNNLEADRTLHNKMFGRFQKFNDGSGQIRTGKDVFDMLTSYNKSFETGELSGLTKSIAEGTADIARKKKGVEKETKPAKKSLTKAEQSKVEDDLNEAPGVRGKDGKYTMTKAEWRADKNRAFSKAYNMLMNGDLDGLIIAKMASGKDIYGQAREEFLNDARDKIGQHILNFDPQMQDSLFGWVNSYISRKVGDVAKKAKRQKEKTPGKRISTDQKIGEEGRTVAETIEGDTASDIEAAVDRSLNAKKKGIDNLRTRLGIEKGGKIYNKVVDAVKKVFGAKLPEVSNKNFKEALKKDFNTLLFKDIKNDIGTRAKYKEFIEGNVTFKDADGNTKTMPRWEMLYDYISQSTFNKRFEPFIEPLINPETGKPLRPDNNPLFTKKKITKQQWVDYFLGDNVQASTKGTRKDALASAIAQELAFDATMETISDPDIQTRIKDIYESQGLRQAENYLEQVAKEIDRTPDSKFSITKDIPVDVNQPKYLVQDALENLKNYLENENTGILSNRPVREIIDDFRKTINSTQDSILEPLFEAIEDKISSSTNPDPDSLSSYEYASKLRDSIIGEILFENLDSSPKPATAFKNLIFSKLSKKQQENYQKPYTTNARNKPLDAAQTKEYTEGIEDLGRFLPDDLKNNTGILTSLAGSNNIRTEQKVKENQKNNKTSKSITNKEVGKLLNKSKNNKKSKVSNSNVTTPNWGGKTGISQSVDNLINDPNFDRNNPKDLAKLKELIDAKYPASKAKELQEVGEAIINALNEMVNSYTPFSPKWWKAFNFAQNVIAAQTNATNGIFRQMAGLNAVSLLSGSKAAFQIEHNVQSGKFGFNALNYIFLEAQAKIQNKNFDFKKELSRLSNMFNRNMMLLDKDIQVVADAKAGSETFNKGLEVLKKKYGEKWLTPERLQRIKDIAGSTTNQAGFNPNMDTLVNNVLAFGIASTTFDTKSGLTYDQVLINQMQGSLAHDLVSKIIEKNINKSTMGKQVLESKSISKTIKTIPEANELFNEMISESAQLQVNPNAENNINENSIKLSLIDSNFDSYKKRNEENNKLSENAPISKFSKTKNTNKENIDELGTVDKALDVARNPKAPIKKIRVFDFDDTLAKSKSLVFYNKPNESGKPVPNNKAIFMIGGPGSGKSNIGKGLQLGRDGWKVVNQDIFIESEKAKAGLPGSEKGYTKEQRSKRAKIGAAGRKAAEAKMDKYTKAGNGMVIDGTGASYNATMKKVNKLKEQGYEVFMVHAKTSNEVALERNRARKERSLPDFIVEKTQQSVNNNIDQYKNDLGDNFIEIDTETIEYGKPLPKEFVDDAKSRFYATERGKLNAEEFAEQGSSLIDQGFAMDFSDFNIVREGEKGPLFNVAKKIQEARGTDDVFVLTARAPESQQAIHEFLKSEGLNIPIENITGLGKSTGEAKAQWLVNKAAEGYNDFYFADDAMQNVDAVKKAMSVLDVKSKVQQAKVKFSKTVDKTINDIIEHKTGIKSESEYSDVKARLKGRKKGRFEIFIPPSAEDFVGLLYKMLGKGEIGNMQMDWFKEHLIEPYGRAMENLSRDQNRMINDFKALKNQLVKEGLIPKNLNKIAFGEYTLQNVARVLAWNKQGFDIPGISKTDLKQILDYAKKNPAIDVFAQNLIDINKGDGYAAPNADWLGGTISTDLLDGLRTGKRSKYLQQWQENVDIIFSPKNLNKMEAAFGTKYREAMEDMLSRMKSGRNRSNKMGRLENRLLDYINNSVGTVMFFNDRSALLQLISSINFIDLGSNNVFKAAKAFANQKQYWKDFMELMNSEFLVERRNGLKLNVSESEIADAAANSKNKAKAAVAWILQKGYLPTQIADSFAIASGGATFYRNRINALMKEGMSEADAKKQAFLEFREIAEESQQSSRPDRVSQQQASVLGRLILAFQNTPMQMNRLGKKAFLDLVNRRKRPGMTQFQSDMSNVSRVTYYFAIQSAIFSALQQALFALAFNDDEEESEKERYYNVANGMLNTFLNGTGMIGVAASTLISVARKVYKESAKEGQFPGPNYEDAANEMLNFSPPIDIKLSKLRQAGLTWKYEGYKHDEANWGIDDPAYKSAAYVISGLTNVPLDRLISKSENVRSAIEDEQQTWKRVSLLLGWRDYQLNSTEERKEYVTSQKEAKKKYREKMKNKGVRQYSPKTLEEQKLEQDRIKYKKLNQAEQVRKLDSLGLSKKQIRSLKYEKDRVAKLIELMSK